MLAMEDNDNAGSLTPRVVLSCIASMLAPTGGSNLNSNFFKPMFTHRARDPARLKQATEHPNNDKKFPRSPVCSNEQFPPPSF
jgi:hypothetical protein